MPAGMTHRQRVLAALAHEEPDRVPIDLGATRNTGITIDAYARLVAWLGLESAASGQAGIGRGLRLAQIDEAVLRYFDVDLRGLFLGPPDGWRDIEIDPITYQDEWGVVRRRPPSSYYYDVVGSPLAGEITVHDIARYPWPDPEDPGLTRGLRERALRLRQETDHALVLHLSDIFVHTSQYLRGFEQWYVDLAADPQLICALFDAILEIRLTIARRALEAVGDLIDVVSVSDDIAGQEGPQISPAMLRRYVWPRFARYFDLIHARTSAKLLYHSCGSVYAVLPDLIDLGVECLNPVQVSAADMDTRRLKREFGEKLVFWGAIDTQRALPSAHLADVEREVQRRIADLAPGGGYILAAVHNIQPDVPPQNIVAMVEAARRGEST